MAPNAKRCFSDTVQTVMNTEKARVIPQRMKKSRRAPGDWAAGSVRKEKESNPPLGIGTFLEEVEVEASFTCGSGSM